MSNNIVNFNESAKLYVSLNKFICDLLYNSYTKKLFQPELLNEIDRDELAEDFSNNYINEYIDDFPENYNSEELKDYVAKEIDRLIPRLYFLEINKELCAKYTPLFVRRIFDIEGKDGFDVVDKLKYKYNHDFSETEKYIKESAASEKQISFLKTLCKNTGHLLWREKYLSKTCANQIIEYLSEKTFIEPVVFSFFIVQK